MSDTLVPNTTEPTAVDVGIDPDARQATPPRRPGRFVTGAAIGALVGGLVGAGVSGGIVAATRHDDSPAATSAPSDDPEPVVASNPIAAIVSKARPSVVSIHDSIAQTDLFGRTVEGQAAGSGFILTADGYVVTNDHVIEGASDITVGLADGTSADATVIAADPASDLAVLKIDQAGLTPLPLGSSDALQVGDQLVAIGNALDLSGEPTVTTGIVSATGRTLTEPNGARLANLIQTDTAINPGNSGGPILNLAGEVVGINTAIAGQAQNVGFAIAIDPARALIDQLQRGEVPEHPLLGVTTRIGAGGSGAEITDITTDSAAADARLRIGDTITAVDGAPVHTPDDLGADIASHSPGDAIDITYLRGTTTHHVTATLGVRPAAG
jgi:S1-C subfamily serine protease